MNHLFNLHTHTNYCDGAENPEAYVQAALKAGFHTLGFSSHAPVPFKNGFAIQSTQDLENYCQVIRRLKADYKDRIDIYLALELDYIRGLSEDFHDMKTEWGLDYTIGSVHLVKNASRKGLWFIDGPRVESYDKGLQDIFGGDIRKAVTTYFDQLNQMVLTQKPDIVGHFDKIKMHNKDRYFKEDDPWYEELWFGTLELIRQSGLVIEINTRGLYKGRYPDLYPGISILKEIKKMGMPVTMSSDAHSPEEIDGHYPQTLKILKQLGFEELVFYSPTGWKGQAI